MNILVVAPHGMYTSFTSSFVHNQARAYVQLGHRVRVVIPVAIAKRDHNGKRFSAPVTLQEVDGVELCFVRHLSLGARGAKMFNGKSSALACKALKKAILKNFTPDVIHGHTIHFGGTVAGALQKKLGVPMVLTTHGGDTDLALEDQMRQSGKALCDAADAVVAVSGAYLEKLRQLGAETHTQRILNGFAVENIQPAEKVRHRVVQVGYLVWRKRAELTVRAVASLRAMYPDISLVLVGDGDQREVLETLCRELKVEDAVTFLGHRSNPEALAEMGQAEVFVMPSVREGFGIVYLEAMASGCVTVGTQGEGIADVIVSGENGFLVPPEDPAQIARVIADCFEDPEKSREIAARGRQEALALTWEKNAREYIDLFTKLQKERGQ